MSDLVRKLLARLPESEEYRVAYSGGKDSTALLLLALMKAEETGSRVVAVFNDTLAELPHMRAWVKLIENFMGENMIVTKPPEPLTFWWGTAIRGYPAPNFKFRWCTKYLKAVPSSRHLKGLVLVGTRKEESKFRSVKVNEFFEEGGFTKVAPLFDLSEGEVWKLLKDLEPYAKRVGFPDLDLLKELYAEGARFGCWFCTVARAQRGLGSLRRFAKGDVRLAESFVNAFRAFLWKLREDRVPKSSGYSRLGPLSVRTRAKAMAAFVVASELSETVVATVGGVSVELFYGLRDKGEITGLEQLNALLRADPVEVERKAKEMGYIKRINLRRLEEAEEVRSLYPEFVDEVREELLSGGAPSYLSY